MNPLHSRLGYPCINVELSEKGIMTNRGMIKRTFDSQKSTLEHASNLALLNVQDLLKIITWNEEHGIKFFRVTSALFPWMSEYELTDLPHWPQIEKVLKDIGNLQTKWSHRLTFHPGPFNVLASKNKWVVNKTIKELNQHSQIFDAMGLKPSHWNKINIHVNTTQGGKEDSAKRFIDGFGKLNIGTKSRLVVENDDKPSQYSVSDLYQLLHTEIGIPITFDVHHHKFCNSGITHETSAKLASTTWGKIPPAFHFASTINHESADQMARAHADWIYDEITDYGTGAWIMCECKQKEKAIISYMNEGIKTSNYIETNKLILS